MEPIHYRSVKRYNVPGHVHFLTFSCHQRKPLFTNEVWRSWLGDEVRNACKVLHYSLWAYVFMPEHVHLMVRPRKEPDNISEFLYSVKKKSGERIIKHLRENKAPLLKQLETSEGATRKHRFWLPGGGYDGNLWSWPKIIQKAEYCHGNPVKRGLVKSAEQWRWSSFRWLVLGRRETEPLEVDDWIDCFE